MNKGRIIKYSKQAVKFIKKQEQFVKDRLRKAIYGLKSIPMVGDILPMEGYNDGRMRLRVGNYRIIFKEINEIEIDIVFIMEIGNRGDIYKQKGEYMSSKVLEVTNLIENLPAEDQELALQMIKKIMLAWDPNYTKVTLREKEIMDKAEQEYETGEIIEDSDEIWNQRNYML